MSTSVFIATSLDGYIADRQGGIEWLNTIPNPDNIDCGFSKFIDKIDAIIMGKNTFKIVDSFDIEWPYSKPVVVLSSTMHVLPEKYQDKANIICGTPIEMIKKVNAIGYKNLYIDSDLTIQRFLKDNLIDEMIITQIPILLGGGMQLFGELSEPQIFELLHSKIYLNSLVQSHYKLIR